jgi:mRNA-degrading endonuclease RelE of RelBE toxin-antitoxin system
MRSVRTAKFLKLLDQLPAEVREQANIAFQRFRENPSHPGLGFKRLSGQEELFSVRIGLGYRALAWLDGETLLWFWIGPHAEYDKRTR